METILITGTAGFIGFHLVKQILDQGYKVIGIDNINNYYDINLKYARLAETGIYDESEEDRQGGKNKTYHQIEFNKSVNSTIFENYTFYRANLEDKTFIQELFFKYNFDYVINLAAQAGVRYSIQNPDVYIQSNVVGFINLLEACRHHSVKHFLYASSSSVYGNGNEIPFKTTQQADKPVSLYAATKKSNELMAYTYSYLYNLPTTGLRFFTVYGPWGRPDMAPMLFAKAIVKNEPINVFNNGFLERDFTYVDDITECLCRVLTKVPKDEVKFSLYNIGNGSPVNLLKFIEIMEKTLGQKAIKTFLPMQPGDVERTWADTQNLEQLIDYKPSTSIESGIQKFAGWFHQFYT